MIKTNLKNLGIIVAVFSLLTLAMAALNAQPKDPSEWNEPENSCAKNPNLPGC